MAHTLRLQRTYRRTRSTVAAAIGAIARMVAAEHTLAQRAASKAASPRQSLEEVRAMYVPACPTCDDGDVAEQITKSVPQTAKDR